MQERRSVNLVTRLSPLALTEDLFFLLCKGETRDVTREQYQLYRYQVAGVDFVFALSPYAVAQFMYIIRRRINLPSEKAMFLFVNKVLPTTR